MCQDKLVLGKLPYWKTVAHLGIFTDWIDRAVIDVAEEKAQIDNQSTNYQDILRIITQLSRYFCLVQDGDFARIDRAW